MYLPLQVIDEAEIAQADSLFRASLQNRVQTFAQMSWEERFHLIGGELWDFGLKVLVAAAIFIVGRWLIKRLVKWLVVIFEKREVDYALRTFLRSLAQTLLYFILFYLIIAWLGINTSLFVAMFAAAGLAIGMAMSGVFQNVAGGMMVLVLKPFKCGDWIELQGEAGKVMDIRLFNTELRTADNRTILLPNGGIYTSIVGNTTAARTRRLEWSLSLALGTDLDAVRKLLLDLLNAEPKLIDPQAREVVLSKITGNTIEILVHARCENTDFWDVFYRLNETIYKTMLANGIDIGGTQEIDVKLTGGNESK
jgi:small conductance mechanosensitive channel